VSFSASRYWGYRLDGDTVLYDIPKPEDAEKIRNTMMWEPHDYRTFLDDYGYTHYMIDDEDCLIIDAPEGRDGLFFSFKGTDMAHATEIYPGQLVDYPSEEMSGCERDSKYEWSINGCMITNVTASSTLTDRYHTYAPEGVRTCYGPYGLWNKNAVPWVEGATGDGIGEKIEFDVTNRWAADHGSQLTILNGYVNPEKPHLFKENNRVKKALVETNTGFSQVVEFRDVVEFTPVDLPKGTTHVTITIQEVYPGSKYHDTCISALEVYYWYWEK